MGAERVREWLGEGVKEEAVASCRVGKQQSRLRPAQKLERSLPSSYDYAPEHKHGCIVYILADYH